MIYSDAKKSLSIDYYRRTYAFSVNERGIASKNATSYTKVQSLKRELYRFHVHKESSHDFKSAATGTEHWMYIQKGPENEYVTLGILD
jgi:carbonic anhydrase